MNNPGLARLYTEMCAHVIDALTRHTYLLGESMSAADLLLAAHCSGMRKILPESDVIDRYIRVVSRPGGTGSARVKSTASRVVFMTERSRRWLPTEDRFRRRCRANGS